MYASSEGEGYTYMVSCFLNVQALQLTSKFGEAALIYFIELIC